MVSVVRVLFWFGWVFAGSELLGSVCVREKKISEFWIKYLHTINVTLGIVAVAGLGSGSAGVNHVFGSVCVLLT